MTLNARFNLKCALRTARLTYVRCGFRLRPYKHSCSQRGGGGVGWRAQPPPCGQLTRSFSAVAELLVRVSVQAYYILSYWLRVVKYHILSAPDNSSSKPSNSTNGRSLFYLLKNANNLQHEWCLMTPTVFSATSSVACCEMMHKLYLQQHNTLY